MPSTEEGKHLAVLMGLQENKIHPEVSNSLDEVAEAMIKGNVDYVEGHIHDDLDQEIPTFHVVHSGSEEYSDEEHGANGAAVPDLTAEKLN